MIIANGVFMAILLGDVDGCKLLLDNGANCSVRNCRQDNNVSNSVHWWS